MISRRSFIKAGGSLVVYFSLTGTPAYSAAGSSVLPASLKVNPSLDSWIRINSSGTVTVFTGKAELGQGLRTALLQIAAEELGVAVDRIEVETVDTDFSPEEGYTAGSLSMQHSGSALRIAAAEARQALVELAAKQLNVNPDMIEVEDGQFIVSNRKSGLDYRSLVAGKRFEITSYTRGKTREPGDYTIIGRSLPRTDIPAKAFAEPAFIQDMRLPGMLHARIIRPPAADAALLEVDTRAAEETAGLVKIIRDGSFLAVVAQREEQAVMAADALRAKCRWSKGRTLPDENRIGQWLLSASVRSETVFARGKPDFGDKDTYASAVYTRPYQAHASVSPSIAIARKADNGLRVWSHAQGMFFLRGAIAGALGLAESEVRCTHVQGSGCYGHNGADDAACDAAMIAMALPGSPIRLQYSREDEFLLEPYGPAMVIRIEAGMDDRKRINAWRHQVWSCTHSTRPMGLADAGNLASANRIAKAVPKPPPRSIPQPTGGGDRNAVPLYTFMDMEIIKHFVPDMPVRVSALRGLGAYANVFAIESFMDEIAARVGADPLEFRLAHLTDQRAIDVLNRLAVLSNWSGQPPDSVSGRGIAFARYKNSAAYCAIAVDAGLDRESGRISVQRVYSAVDAGQIVNPDGIKNQIEGGIIQSLSWTLKEQVRFSQEQILSRDWSTYPILTFTEVPDIRIELINRPGLPFLGTGEASQGPTAGALANALADAGLRIHDIPFTPDRVRQTMIAAG